MPYNIDLHCHTSASPDGSLNEKDFKRAFDNGRLDVVAVTDHDTIEGAQQLQETFGRDRIIVGEEISTSQGEIIGLYLSELVKKGMTAVETVAAIKKQGGVVYIPHPFEKGRSGVTMAVLDQIMDDVDIIEVVNGRSFSAKARKEAVVKSRVHNLAPAASSDAHGRIGWGRVYTVIPEMPNPDKPQSLVELLHRGVPNGNLNGVVSYAYPKRNRWSRKAGLRP